MTESTLKLLEEMAQTLFKIILDEKNELHQEKERQRQIAEWLTNVKKAKESSTKPALATTPLTKQQNIETTIVTFTLQEITKMSQPFKKEFIANGLTATVTKRKSGKDTICYQIRYRRHGYYIEASSTDLEEAKRKFLEKTTIKEIGKYKIDPDKKSKSKLQLVFNEWINYKIHTKSINEKGIQRYKVDFNALPNELKQMPIEKIKTSMLTEVMKDVKPRKYEELRTLFNQIFKYAMGNGITPHNPVILIPFKRAERKIRETLSKNDILNFLTKLQEPEFDKIRQGAYLLYFFGLRPCEIDAETRREGDFLITRNRKRKNGRVEYKKIPIPSQAQGLIDWNSPLTFQCEEYDRPKYFKKLFKGKFTAYNLRHTFCTLCQEAGVSQEIVEVWMGDSAQRLIGQVYTHYSDSFMKKQMELVIFPTID